MKDGAKMKLNAIITVRVLKRLKAAVGYHELGMTQHALRCLDSVELLDTIGRFHLVADILRGEFANHVEKEISAAKALETVAWMVPGQERRAIRMTLAACYGKTNEGRTASESETSARAEV